MYEMRNIRPYGKRLNDFYLLVAMQQNFLHFAHLFVFFFDASQLVNKNRLCALSVE